MRPLWPWLLLALSAPALCWAEVPQARASRVETAPRIDGQLDDPAWQGVAPLELSLEIDPGDNLPAQALTECFVVFDHEALYVAFRALDPEPDSIRAHLSDRDETSRDDLVGFVIDPFNDERRGFAYLVNPLGVQADLTVTGVGTPELGPFSLSGAPDEDRAWDSIWAAAAQIDARGYTAEFKIPFTSLRFPRQAGVQTWGFAPTRVRPRSTRARFAAAPIDRGRSCFLCQAPKLVGIVDVRPGRDIELDPTATFLHGDLSERTAQGIEPDRRDKGELGLTARWGMTPNLTLGAAVNPDFAQIEADAPQINVNTRFALFFPEKRPFFLEGADFFGTPIAAVHTRVFVDPEWAVKLTGKEGRHAVGAFITRDAATTFLFPANEGSRSVRLDREPNTAAVLRWRYDVGPRSTIGLLGSGRTGHDYSNALLGVDGRFQLGDRDTLEFQQLRTRTDYTAQLVRDFAQPPGAFGGDATWLRLRHATRDWDFAGAYQRKSPGFRADTGFVAQVDSRDYRFDADRLIDGGPGALFHRTRIGVSLIRAEDDGGLRTDDAAELHAQLNGPLQSFLVLTTQRESERFAGQFFHESRHTLFFNVRPSGAFTSSIRLEYRDAIDFAAARPARQRSVSPEFTWNIGRHLFITGDHTWQRLVADGAELFTVNQTSGKVVYQFSTRSFLRALLRRTAVDGPGESFTDQFVQGLFTYKVNPFTVLYAGYSDCRDCDALPPQDDPRRRPERLETIFIKLGYSWQL